MKLIRLFRHFFLTLALIFGATLLFFPLTINAQTLSTNDNYRAVFTWRLPANEQLTIDYFDLLIDDQIYLQSLLNQEADTVSYTLTLDNTTDQYQLIIDDSFVIGDHTWQIKAFQNNQKEALFVSEPKTFTVSPQTSLWQETTSGQLWQALQEASQRILTFLTFSGSTIFLIFFSIFFFFDLISSKTLAQFFDKNKFTNGTNQLAGFIFDTQTDNGVPFANITFTSLAKNAQGQPLVEENVVSDVNGLYRALKLPIGEYRINARRQGFTFPSQKNRSQLISEEEFYQGEVLTVHDEEQLLRPQIPLDPIVSQLGHTSSPVNFFWRTWLTLRHNQSTLETVLFLLSFSKILLHPTWPFVALTIFYGAFVLYHLWQKLTPTALKGLVVDEYGQPLTNVNVELYNDLDHTFLSLQLTDSKGRFHFSLKPGTYSLIIKKSGYINKNDVLSQDTNARFVYNKKPLKKILEMQLAPQLDQSFFLDEQAKTQTS